MSVRRQPAVGPTGATGSTGLTGATGATGPAGTAPAGVPVLRGPYVVDYTDIPHDGDTHTLWTPQVGDVLLHIFPDSATVTQWDHGELFIGQNVDGTVLPPHNALVDGSVALLSAGHTDARKLDIFQTAFVVDSGGTQIPACAYVFHTTDPVQIQLAQTGGTDPTQGHLELYALVARAVAP